jgi:thiamine biosynthesis lipoprotein
MGPRTDGPPSLKKMILPALFVGGLFYVTMTRTPEPEPPQMVVQGTALGTTWTLKVVEAYAPERETELRALVDAAIAEVDVSMSTYRDDSELIRLNAAEGLEPIAVSDMLGAVLSEAFDIGAASGGALDVTVGPLVDAWGFGRDKRSVAPSEETIATLRDRIGQDKIELTQAGLTKANPSVSIDLSAIAKGYAVDRAVDALERSGVTNLMVELGGEIVARGHNRTGADWKLGIETPTESGRELFHAVPLVNSAMATSGDYRQYYEVDGRRVSHLIDPRTARPIEHKLASVTVIADRCSTADGWATALSVLGEEEGMAVAKSEGLKAYFIVRTSDGGFESRSTPAFDSLTP